MYKALSKRIANKILSSFLLLLIMFFLFLLPVLLVLVVVVVVVVVLVLLLLLLLLLLLPTAFITLYTLVSVQLSVQYACVRVYIDVSNL